MQTICKECLYWIEDKDNPDRSIARGYCHGGPPSVLWSKTDEDCIMTIWPITRETEGCGAFYPKCESNASES